MEAGKPIPKKKMSPEDLMALLLRQQEEKKLYKIIKNSERVKQARRMFNLNEGEYIANFQVYKGWDETVIMDKSGKRINKKMVDHHKTDYGYYDEVIATFVRIKIINYFKINLPEEFVMDAIFKKPFVPKSFRYSSLLNNDGFLKITIELFAVPNAMNLEAIMERIKVDCLRLNALHKSKNTQGLNTKQLSFKQIKEVPNFDEKFEIYQRYKNLQSKKPRISRQELENLVMEAKRMLKQKDSVAFNERNLRKIIKDFGEYFYS